MDLGSLTKKIAKKAAVGLIGTTLAIGTLGLSGCYSTDRAIQDTPTSQPPRGQSYFFACNYWQDLNNNKLFDYPTEFVGIKTTFKDIEQITIVGGPFANEIGQTCRMDIISPRGELIDNPTYVFVKPNEGVISITGNDVVKELVSEFGHGTYRIVWYVDNNAIADTSFDIVPSEQILPMYDHNPGSA